MSSIEKTSSLSCNSITGEKNNMKQFILAAQDYNKTKCEETSSLLSRYLQVNIYKVYLIALFNLFFQLLGLTQDLYTFDPHNSVAVQFFMSLHELMTTLDSKSNLMWCGVTVLQHACKNPATHKALIHVYQFLPILSKLLGDNLTREKKIKLLTLMQVSDLK